MTREFVCIHCRATRTPDLAPQCPKASGVGGIQGHEWEGHEWAPVASKDCGHCGEPGHYDGACPRSARTIVGPVREKGHARCVWCTSSDHLGIECSQRPSIEGKLREAYLAGLRVGRQQGGAPR